MITTFAKCASYERGEVEKAVGRVWEEVFAGSAGGSPAYDAGKMPALPVRVLVKPNLLREAKPEEAVTTHPEVVRACVKKLLEAGAKVVVGDSPAFVANLSNVWKSTGIQAVCEELGVPLIALEQQGVKSYENESGGFSICNAALDVDLILNLPKVKTHGLTLLTAAAKNLYGLVPGHVKTQLHKTHPSARRFGALIRGVVGTLPRVVTIADGVIGMEGDGPSAGSPVELGFIAGGDDVFALDWHLCEVLGLPRSRVPTLDDTEEPEAARGDVITLPRPVKQPHGSPLSILDKMPMWIAKGVGRLIWFRPRIEGKKCVGCGKCVKACPVKALEMVKKRGKVDRAGALSYPRRCIGCCCCSEVCPVHAIKMRSSFLVRLAGW